LTGHENVVEALYLTFFPYFSTWYSILSKTLFTSYPFINYKERDAKAASATHFIKLYALLFTPFFIQEGAGVAQSVQCRTADRKTGVQSPAKAKDFSSSFSVQTSSEANPASYPTEGPLLGVKCGQSVTLTTHPHLVPRSRWVEAGIFLWWNMPECCAINSFSEGCKLEWRSRSYFFWHQYNTSPSPTELGDTMR
jgi:hypothetical protein